MTYRKRAAGTTRKQMAARREWEREHEHAAPAGVTVRKLTPEELAAHQRRLAEARAQRRASPPPGPEASDA